MATRRPAAALGVLLASYGSDDCCRADAGDGVLYTNVAWTSHWITAWSPLESFATR